MLCVMRVVECMKLKFKKPIKSCIDNKGDANLAKNWPVGDRIRHCEIKDYFFLRELKEKTLKSIGLKKKIIKTM